MSCNRARNIFTCWLLVALGVAGCHEPSTRFVILSDLHPHPDAFDQVELLTQHVIDLEPAFVFVLGDIANDAVPGASEREIEVIRTAFNRMRSAGIEIYPDMGNHDVHERVEQLKVDWFCGQEPQPLNHLFDAQAGTEAYRLFTGGGPDDYSFTHGIR